MNSATGIKYFCIVLTGFFALTACSMERDDLGEGNTTLNVSLVDAPADYEEVWVEILSVEVLSAGVDEARGWISLDIEEGEIKVDLLTLVGEKSANIGSKEFPAGKIDQLRLMFGEDNYLVQNGVEFPLKIPSAKQSGIKLHLDKELQAGVAYKLTLDFHAAQSIVRAGDSGQYLLKPVIRVIQDDAATIKGRIVTQGTDPVIYGMSREDTVSTFTDENGIFQFRGLPNGEYEVHIYPTAPFSPEFIKEIHTVNGEIVDIGEIDLEISGEDSEE